MDHQTKWMERMVDKYGSEEAVRAAMREFGNKSSRNTGGKGGFAKLKVENPDKFYEVTSKGGKISKR